LQISAPGTPNKSSNTKKIKEKFDMTKYFTTPSRKGESKTRNTFFSENKGVKANFQSAKRSASISNTPYDKNKDSLDANKAL
jgi:hypothetical protein